MIFYINSRTIAEASVRQADILQESTRTERKSRSSKLNRFSLGVEKLFKMKDSLEPLFAPEYEKCIMYYGYCKELEYRGTIIRKE